MSEEPGTLTRWPGVPWTGEPTTGLVLAVRGGMARRRLEMRLITLIRNSGVFLPEGTALLRKQVLLSEWVNGESILWTAWNPSVRRLGVYSRWPISVLTRVGIKVTTDASGDICIEPAQKLWDGNPAERRYHLIREYLRAKSNKEAIARGEWPSPVIPLSTGAAQALERVGKVLADAAEGSAAFADGVQAGREAVASSA